ncbi:hypothetical protein C3486_05140 [Streptomyces sp. Ru73]|uniref:hypothetical protein n=1 Tax=Streptomyces sp. Ru73 TaxID=2080748 RepID=UPI000CDD3648|nr:hypothetical protein [Streptomyces sp. Ru73]POX42395.1 hypothetical protein C3486_05140 [Streptomyces sp. Ru73]
MTVVIAIAISLLPVLVVLLYTTDRLEDWLLGQSPTARQARGRHLELVHSNDAADGRRTGRRTDRSGTEHTQQSDAA